jgi:hypoxanthine-DNA glycosylase
MLPPAGAAGHEALILILGSFPGARSLAEQRYYAHPQNRFWRFLGAAAGLPLAEAAPAGRLGLLEQGGIALWDVLAAADRVGSLDAAIRNPVANDIAGFAATLPKLRAIACNGGTSFRLSLPWRARVAVPVLRLPSSSPANARTPAAVLEREWADTLRPYLSPPK